VIHNVIRIAAKVISRKLSPGAFTPLARIGAILGLLALAGCTHPDLAHLDNPKTGGAFPNIWNKTPVTQLRALAEPATLTSVKNASLSGLDRIVFTFSGKEIPGYAMRYQGEGSDQGAKGPVLFEMRFGARPIWGHGNEAEIHRQLNYPVLKALSESKIGEEFTFWTATLSKNSDYRLTELRNPPRLVVDFKH